MPPLNQRRHGDDETFESPEIESDHSVENETQYEIQDSVKEKLSGHHRPQSGEIVLSLLSKGEDGSEQKHENMANIPTHHCSKDLGSSVNLHAILFDSSSSSSSISSDNEDDRDSQPDSLHEFQHHALGSPSLSEKSQYRRAHYQLPAATQPNTQVPKKPTNRCLPDSLTQVNGIDLLSSTQHLSDDDLLPDTQVNIRSIHRSFGGSSCTLTKINPPEPRASLFSFSGDDLLPDTQVNCPKLDACLDDGSGSPTQMNIIKTHDSIKRVSRDDELSDTQANTQITNHFTKCTHNYSATPKYTIINHLPSKSSHFDTSPPFPQIGTLHKYASPPDGIQTFTTCNEGARNTQTHDANDSFFQTRNADSVLEDEDIPDTQRQSSRVSGCRPTSTQASISGDEGLPDTQIGSFHRPKRQALGLTDSTLDRNLPTAQPKMLCPSSQLPNTPLSSQSFSEDDFADTQASIAPTLFRRKSTSALIASFRSDLSVPLPEAEKAPLNKISCRERKTIVTSFNCPPSLMKAMKQWIRKTHNLLDPFREDDDCWFHPSPPAARVTSSGLRPVGKLQRHFAWQDHRGKHSLVLNYGIVSKIVNYKMTKQQKDGFINKQWHLSHLCGNWTCLNPTHTTVEPGGINISRNNCFSHRSGCHHEPKCMKDKKVSLAPDGKPINHSTSYTRGEATQQAVDNWDDWSMQSFDNGEVSILINDQDETEFVLHGEDDDEDAPVEQEGGRP
ncbi:hypothetical protein BDZ45DRAFT_339299 [Acephala macrosclerotiorum]|nr:hypothetical protein BDZ45DRAFT_339299 [Acephala macrosclerotiorum]